LIVLLFVQVNKAVAALFKDYKARTAAAGSTPLLEDGENITVSLLASLCSRATIA
jgi:hypothetical protein